MVRGRIVRWTENASFEFKAICEYWNNRNKSTLYSKKLRLALKATLSDIKTYPYSGSASNMENVYFKVIGNYLLLYTILYNDIIILSFWDGRQDPEKLKKRLE